VPRYFLTLSEDGAPRPWDPHAGPRPERADTRYFGAVLAEMETTLEDLEIDLYLTWDTERLPAYGDRVVAVVLGDEVGRIPAYVGRVRAVFKCYGIRPVLGAGPLRDPSLTGLVSLGQCAVRWLRWLPGGAAHARLELSRRLRGWPASPAIATIPLGTYNQLDVPVVPMAERPTDLFFAGSVEHRPSLRHRLSPKTRHRRDMLAAVERFRGRRPGLLVDLRLTPGFEASKAGSAATYSQGLMNAKVCLAPRGTSLETFRVFEGLRYGCVVVADRLPRHWFYKGAPMLQLDRWDGLEAAVAPLLDDRRALDRWHVRTMRWWRERCSEAAVGRFMAARLNELSRAGDVRAGKPPARGRSPAPPKRSRR
jgi:hypothetical protein